MKLKIPYGRTSVALQVPPGTLLNTLEPTPRSPLRDPQEAIRDALRYPIGTPPLRQLVRSGERVAIVVNDVTRLVHTDVFLPVLVDELNAAGVPDGSIFVVFALGTHRPQTPEERRGIVGKEMAQRLELFEHDCSDRRGLVRVGRTSRGHEVWVNRRVWEADRIILTGEIVPHLIAGYSGGRKSLFPGLADAEFIRRNHSLVLDPACRIGVLDGNPAHEDLLEACRLFGPDFILNVILNSAGQFLSVVAGHYDAAHRAGCQRIDEFYGTSLADPYDVVIAGSGGYPLDIDLRQAHKGMENAARALRPGGSLVYFADCTDGAGSAALQEWIERGVTAAELETSLRENFVVGAHKAYWLARL